MSVDIYEQLRGAIATGQLHPNERLVEADLSTRYSASRGAVRTALVRLEQEGLVEHERNRGARVRFIGEAEAIEIYEVRAQLEGLAARKAAELATEDDVARLNGLVADIRSRLDANDLMGASEVNMQLHSAIMEVARHETASRLVSNLNSHLVRYHYRTIMQPGRPEKSFAEHSAVVDAIVRRDPDAAEQAMRAHLAQLTRTLVDPIRSADV